jgi:hypothetical protein
MGKRSGPSRADRHSVRHRQRDQSIMLWRFGVRCERGAKQRGCGTRSNSGSESPLACQVTSTGIAGTILRRRYMETFAPANRHLTAP